jgi:hypothetical protein
MSDEKRRRVKDVHGVVWEVHSGKPGLGAELPRDGCSAIEHKALRAEVEQLKAQLAEKDQLLTLAEQSHLDSINKWNAEESRAEAAEAQLAEAQDLAGSYAAKAEQLDGRGSG